MASSSNFKLSSPSAEIEMTFGSVPGLGRPFSFLLIESNFFLASVYFSLLPSALALIICSLSPSSLPDETPVGSNATLCPPTKAPSTPFRVLSVNLPSESVVPVENGPTAKLPSIGSGENTSLTFASGSPSQVTMPDTGAIVLSPPEPNLT